MEDDIILEGYLKKWTGLLTGWRDRYFTLKEKGTLEFADKHHNKDRGVIHLKIAKISLTPKDPLRITIDSGLKEINLRASSIIDKYRWVTALREAAYGGNSEQADASQNKMSSSQRATTNTSNRASSMMNREPYIEGTFRKIYDYQNQILGVISNLHGKSLAKDVKEQLAKMEGLFKEMMQNIVEWKDIIAAENERIERMKEKLDNYFDNLDGVRVNVDDGTMKEFTAADDSGPKSGQHKRNKPVLTQQNSFGESSIQGSESNQVGDPVLQTNQRGLSFSEVSEKKEETQQQTKLFPIADEGSPIERSAEKLKASGTADTSPQKLPFIESPTKIEVMELPNHSENEIKKSRMIERESFETNEAVEARNKESQVKEEEEEEEEKVEELAKTSRMMTTRRNGGDVSEDEEQFYSVLNPQIQLSKSNNRTIVNDKTLEGGTMFHTVIADDTQDLEKDEEVKLQDAELGVLKYLDGQDATENNQVAEPNPFVQKLLKENSAFKGLKIPFVNTRDRLPSELPPNIGEKASNYTGINTLEVPLSYHEPLSILQKLCEQFEYSELLDQADDLSDSLLRMAYTIAFVISGYHTTSRRLTKPFDALLGETYEYSCDDNNFKFVAEQTSIEPPITVYYGSSDYFEVNGSMSMKTEFLGKCVEVKLEGKNEIRLKRSGDVYVFTRPITSLDHIITGKYCISNYGEMRFKNLKTQENATVSLLKRSWDEKSVNRLEGYIKDNKGQFVYKVSGKWDEEISIEHLQTKESRLIWRRKMLDTPEKNFGFTHLALQLNYLHHDLLNQLPQTDSRFRPDVRAIENGDYELASTEKRRLKEKEQKLVKVLKNNNTPYKPKWFNPVKVEEGAERFFLFNNKYFNQKLNDPDTFDLYN